MIKIKLYFKDKFNNFINYFKSLPKNFATWWVSLYIWITKIPHNTNKKAILIKQKIVSFPSDTKKVFNKIKNMTLKDWYELIKKFIIRNAILLSLSILIIVFIVMNKNFLSGSNISNILKNSTYRLLFALGVGTIIVGKGTDLSIGRVVGFTSMIVAIFSQSIFGAPVFKNILGQNPFVIVLISVFIGMFFGFINGVVVTKFRVDPFIATLGMMLVAYGGSYLLQDKFKVASIGGFSKIYTDITIKPVIEIGNLKIPMSVIISLIIAFFMWVLWNKTPIGRKIFATGGNRAAADVSGIKTGKIILFTFVLAGALYGIGTIFLTWSSAAVSPQTATMYELDAISACIVGGLSFNGGKGKISGIIIGVLIFECISVGFTLLNLRTWITYLVKGIIIILAVTFDMIKEKVRK